MVLSAIEAAEEECKRAPNRSEGGHSLRQYVNPPRWPKPPASTAASTPASRSPRSAGDSPRIATFLGLHCVMAVAPRVLTQDEFPASSTAAHSRAAALLVKRLRRLNPATGA